MTVTERDKDDIVKLIIHVCQLSKEVNRRKKKSAGRAVSTDSGSVDKKKKKKIDSKKG